MPILKLHNMPKLCASLVLGLALTACGEVEELEPAITHGNLILPLNAEEGAIVGFLGVVRAPSPITGWEIISGNTDNLLSLGNDGFLLVARPPRSVLPRPAATYTLRVRVRFAATESEGDIIVLTGIRLFSSSDPYEAVVDIDGGRAATFTVNQLLCRAASGICCVLDFSTIGRYPRSARIVSTRVDRSTIRYAFPPFATTRTVRLAMSAAPGQTCYGGVPRLDLAAANADSTQQISARGSRDTQDNVGIMRLAGHDYLVDISRRATGVAAAFAIVTQQYHRNASSEGLGVPFFSLHYAPTAEPSALSEAAVDAHKFSQFTFDYLKEVLGMTSFDGHGEPMLAVTDADSPSRDVTFQCRGERVSIPVGSRVAAFWNGSAISFTPLVGDRALRPLSASLDVVAHEWGHAVSGAAVTGGLRYERESGALSEAYSDWLGIAVERSFEAANPDWLLGEDAYRQARRSVSEPNDFEQPNTYQGQHWQETSDNPNVECHGLCNDNCGVHTNSGVGNKMFYLLSVGGTQNGVTVTGIGVTKAIQIATQAVRQYWTSNITYAEARTTMAMAAMDLFGVTEREQVLLAWNAVGVTGN